MSTFYKYGEKRLQPPIFLQVSLVQMFMADDATKYYNAEVLLPD